MNNKEILELRKRFTKDGATFHALCGCYVDANKKMIHKWSGSFLNLVDEEFYKYLEIAKKSLSGKIGNNLFTLEFPMEEEKNGGRQHSLMALRSADLESGAADVLLEQYYQEIIDNYERAGNYLILFFADAYDVIRKTSDGASLEDSEEVFEYIICSICPVDLSKPSLGYNEDESRIGSLSRDWTVGAPETAFLFPAFTERSADIHAALFYTKNAKAPHWEIAESILGCPAKKTNIEKTEMLKTAIDNNIECEDDSVYLEINQTINDIVEDKIERTSQTPIFNEQFLNEVLEECKIEKDKKENIISYCSDIFNDDTKGKDLIDNKALLESEKRQEKHVLEEKILELTKIINSQNNANAEPGMVHVKMSDDISYEIKEMDGKKCICLNTDCNICINGEVVN